MLFAFCLFGYSFVSFLRAVNRQHGRGMRFETPTLPFRENRRHKQILYYIGAEYYRPESRRTSRNKTDTFYQKKYILRRVEQLLFSKKMLISSQLFVSVVGSLRSPLRIMPFGDSITVWECASNGYTSAADHAIFNPLNETCGQNDQGTGYPYPNGTYFVAAHGGYRGFLGHALAATPSSSPAWTFAGSQFDCGNHEGYSGETVGWLANRTTAIMENAQPDIVLFMAGTNDFFWPVNDPHHGCRTTACVTTRLRKLLDLTFTAVPTTTFLLSTITHINEARCKFYGTAHWHPGNCPSDMQSNIIAFNKLLPAIAAEYAAKGFDIAVHDVNVEAQFVDADYWIWGIHFNATGFQKMANVWGHAITSSAKWKSRAATLSASSSP